MYSAADTFPPMGRGRKMFLCLGKQRENKTARAAHNKEEREKKERKGPCKRHKIEGIANREGPFLRHFEL